LSLFRSQGQERRVGNAFGFTGRAREGERRRKRKKGAPIFSFQREERGGRQEHWPVSNSKRDEGRGRNRKGRKEERARG